MATRMELGGGGAATEGAVMDMLNGVNRDNSMKLKKCAEMNGYIKNGNLKSQPKNGMRNHITTENDHSKSNGKALQNGSAKHSDNKSEKYKPKNRVVRESFESAAILTAIMVNLGFYIIMLLGYVRLLIFSLKHTSLKTEPNREKYTPLYQKFVIFYSLYLFRRIKDCWNHTVRGVPCNNITILDRISPDSGWTFLHTGTQRTCINLGSYNYLGFAENKGPCAEAAIEAIYKHGVSMYSSRTKYGTCDIHIELEKLTAEFLGVEDAVTFGMGFATNALNLPVLMSPGCLVISDNKNHASIILGIRMSGATVQVFDHNDVKHLEKLLINAIADGQPKRKEYTPWKKILIIVEGIYSMEGTIVRLPEIIELKKKYKAYLYLDEAHSIGAMGKHGKGIVDYFNCDPKDVDILMGTFTKSFGSAGGYIAGKKEIISYIRRHSLASRMATAMSPPVAAQIIAVLKILMGKDGTNQGCKRIETLGRNTRYLRKRLEQIGVIVHGNENSPVVPVLVFYYSKLVAMMRMMLEENIATVGVGYPATPLMQCRLRICLSAAHTKEELDRILSVIDRVSRDIGVQYSRKKRDMTPVDYYSLELYE